jgi:rubrerythrin
MDIPEGTKVNKVMNGGENTLKIIMDLLENKDFSGYVSIKLKSQNDDISSFLIVQDSKPTFGIREVISQKQDSNKKVRRVYAGESTIDDVKEDSFNEKAKIEIHSLADVDDIIDQYSQDKKEIKEPETETQESTADSRRVGLFWGGGDADNEQLERQVLQEKMRAWETKGYVISGLENVFSHDIKEVKAAFERYEEAVNMLEELAAEIEILSMAGFEDEVRKIRDKLNDPSQILSIKAHIEALEKMASQTEMDESSQDNGHKNVCIVCGFPLGDEAKCPRCGALITKKVEEYPKKEIELLQGRVYLIEEDKLDNTMNIFIDMLNKGYKGFAITRTNPKYLKDKGDLKDAKIIWLTDKESSSISTIPPILERIIYEIGDFVKNEEKTILLLDGIEFLVSSNGFDPVLRFIRTLIDDVSESQSVFLVAIGPDTLKNQEQNILEREMEKISYIE